MLCIFLEKITELLSSISKIKSKYAWCNEEDFEFSILSLARIQATYRYCQLSYTFLKIYAHKYDNLCIDVMTSNM